MLNISVNENSKFAQKKWHVIGSESKGKYSHPKPITFLTKSIESSLCDNSDACLSGNIAVKRSSGADTADVALGAITQVAFKTCAPFEKCSTEIDGTLVDEADFINITMPMYSLIEYSESYSDTSGSLWGFRRDEIVDNANVTNDDNSPSFKDKASIIGNTENNGTKDGAIIAVPLNYLSNFWRSLEMPFINCKVKLSLNWIEHCVLTTPANANKTTFKITDAKLYVLIVTLSIEDNAKLSKLLGKGFQRSIYWNKYRVIDNRVVEIADNNEEKYIRELLDSSYQGVKRLFVLAYYNTEGNNQVSIHSSKKYFLPRNKIENYNIEINGRNFCDQPINDSIK